MGRTHDPEQPFYEGQIHMTYSSGVIGGANLHREKFQSGRGQLMSRDLYSPHHTEQRFYGNKLSKMYIY